MKNFFCFFVLPIALISSCNSTNQNKQDQSWRQEVDIIDSEITKLTQQETEINHEANELERQSLIYMRDDWEKYSKVIEQVEKDHKNREEIEKQIEDLKVKKQKILDSHKE